MNIKKYVNSIDIMQISDIYTSFTGIAFVFLILMELRAHKFQEAEEQNRIFFSQRCKISNTNWISNAEKCVYICLFLLHI